MGILKKCRICLGGMNLDKLERSRVAGTISVFVDLEQDPNRREQLLRLMNALQSNDTLTKVEKKLLKTFVEVTDGFLSYV